MSVKAPAYGWSDLLADVTIALDRRGVQRRYVHGAGDIHQVAEACEQLLAALGVEGTDPPQDHP